ncbi:hypothetical protein [Methanobrevibacter sp.]
MICKNNLMIILSIVLILFLSLSCTYAISDSNETVEFENDLSGSVSIDSNTNFNDDTSLNSGVSQENLLGSTNDSDVLEDHRYMTVDNWDDLKKYAEDDENRYTIYLKENTVFTPTSQIVCNQKISILGNDGVVIGTNGSSSVSVSPFVFNAEKIIIKDIAFKYISSRVMYIKGDASITNCSFDHIGGNSIYLNGGHVNVYDCNFTNGNQAIILYGDENVGPYYSFMNIYNSNFINLRSGEYAGAIRNSGQLLLVNCSFKNNRANTWGGCIASNPTTNITIYNSTFENNVAGWNGGAISTYSYLQVYNTVFRGNNCTTNYGGGAIFALTYVSDAHLWIVNSTFENNINTCFETSTISTGFLGKGGAISIGDSSTLNVYNSTFIGNLAANGHAICSSGYEGYGDPVTVIGGNTFINHTGESETLMGKATVYGNTFINSNVHYNLYSTYSVFYLGQSSSISLNLENPSYYDSDLLSRTNFTLFITNPGGSVGTVNLKGNETYEFAPTIAGKYVFYAESSSFSGRSANLSVVVTGFESPVINDENIEDYFDNTGENKHGSDRIYKLKENLNVYNDTILIGSLTKKILIINQKLNIVGKENNCLTDCEITLFSTASGSKVDGLNFKGTNYERLSIKGYSYIALEKGVKDVNVVNNNFNISGDGRTVSAIELNAEGDYAISNINIINNTLVIDSSGENAYGIYASSNKEESLNYILIVGNNISINGTDHIEAIYLYKIGDSIVKDNVIGVFANGSEEIIDAYGINAYGISGVNITNNVIGAESSKAAYGVTLSESNKMNVLDNEINVDGISAIGLGLTGSSSKDINLMNNDLTVNAGDYSSITTYDDKFGTGANGIVVSDGASANICNNKLEGNASSINTAGAGEITNRSTVDPEPTVNKLNSKFYYTSITVFAAANSGESNNVYFKVKLLDNSNNAIKSRTVTVRYNGVDYKVITDSNGVVQLKVNIPVSGTYGFSVRFDGDDNYNASSGNYNILVKKNTVKITVKTKKVKKSKSKRTVKFVFKTSKNQVLKSKKVKLTINKKTYTVKTNKKGLATFKVKLPNKKKSYKYKLAFAGDKMNSAKSMSGKLKVY